jgi:uncharacterized protein (TIGR03083 family)
MQTSAVRAAIHDAAQYLAGLLDRAPAGAWDGPGLGEWNLRHLAGHASRSLLTIEEYLQGQAEEPPELASAVDYFLAALAIVRQAAPGAISQRGRQAGEALGDDPASAVRAIAERTLPLMDAASDDLVVPTIAGRMRFGDYLPTRLFELTVHSLDVAAATGQPLEPPPNAARLCIELAGELAAAQLGAGELLLAITGRRALPAAFSVM